MAVIHNRRFYWRYPDGTMKPVQMSERVKGALHQIKATEARDANQSLLGN